MEQATPEYKSAAQRLEALQAELRVVDELQGATGAGDVALLSKAVAEVVLERPKSSVDVITVAATRKNLLTWPVARFFLFSNCSA